MGFLSPPARPSRNEVADEEPLFETAVRHCRRPGHAGLGLSQAQAVQAALSAGERRGRRAARALFVHRLRRLPRGAAGRARSHGERPHAPGARQPAGTAAGIARCARAHAASEAAYSRRAAARRPRRSRGLRPGATFRATAGAGTSRRADAASSLSRAAIDAGVRSPDARRRAAARGQRKRAQLVAQASRAGAARRDSPERQAHSLLAGDRQPERRRVHSRRSPHQGIHRRRRRLSAGAVGALLRASASWSRSKPTARCDC